MLGEIGNITSSNYGFNFSKPVSESVLSLKTSLDRQLKAEKSQIDAFIKSNENQNTSYTNSGKVSNILNKDETGKTDSKNKSDQNKKTETTAIGKELKPEAKKQADELKRIDTSVKAHEQAHMSAGGGLVRGGASYQYQKGPDGQMYAVGGEVQIDISPVSNNPEATLFKMQQVVRAALAPADPSGQDRAVASTATQIQSQALEEKQQESVQTPSKTKSETKARTESVTKLESSNIQKYSNSSNLKTNSNFNMLVG